MFMQVLAAVCLCASDETPSNSRPLQQRFDFRRAAEWLFGKRAPSPMASSSNAQVPTKGDPMNLLDSRTEVRVRSAVFADPALRASGMTIRVVEGVAFLEGMIATRWQRLRAEQLARGTAGVVRVENALQVGETTSDISLSQSPVDAPASAQPLVETTAAASQEQSSPTVVSRPKSLPTDDSGLVVMTYSIRRTTANLGLRPAVATESPSKSAAAPTKREGGRLVPWVEGDSESSTPLLNPFGLPGLNPPASVDRRRSSESVDLAVQRALTASPFGDRLTFDRSGKDVVLKGVAPSAALFELAQEIGRIPGIGTVAIAARTSPEGINHKPRTSAIE